MSMSVGSTGGAAKLLAALRNGKVRDAASAEKASGLSRAAVTDALRRMKDAGLVTYEKLHLRAIDWSTVRAVEEKHAAKPAPAQALAPVRAAPPPAAVVTQPEPRAEPRLGKRLVDCDVLSQALLDIREPRTLAGVERVEIALLGSIPIPTQFVEGLRALAEAVDGNAPAPLPAAVPAPSASPPPVKAAPVKAAPVTAHAPAAAAKVARVQAPAPAPKPASKGYRVEDGLGNELAVEDSLARAVVRWRKRDAVRIVDVATRAVLRVKEESSISGSDDEEE